MPSLTLFQAFDLFLLDKQASGYSLNTLRNYRNTIAKTRLYFTSDTQLTTIAREHWVGFLAWLQDDYTTSPAGIAPRGEIHLSQKSICNIHTDLSSFYTWAVKQQYVETHLLRTIDRPRFEKPAIETFTQDDVKRLLRVCGADVDGKNSIEQCVHYTALRNRAVILTLLSTGARVSEICAACIKDLNIAERSLKVAGKGKGRDSKERMVYLGARSTRAVTRYLVTREDRQDEDPLFCVVPEREHRPFTRDTLGRLLRRIGDRAGIPDVHAHRFRHTFAVNYLRNGGDVLTLQAILGHESLEMVRHYARVAAQDCARVHRSADPVDNWKL